ncbi:hypothetical protein LLEC1_02971 [Akanthomyces lecanii]|uniref:ABC transporter domain-containing protein n=1 Tax=Cordyceps confragosa TaxID=2714763 RepID=A0A179IFY4_CORDF|nr:hypothetical protein LLEC1_02971 [Akanthomyces lecanii]
MSPPCGWPNDFSFGPSVNPCYRCFDFTLFFEDTILSLVPSSIFIPIAAFYIAILPRKNPVAIRSKWYTTKLVAYTALVMTHCIFLTATVRDSIDVTAAGVSAATLALVSSILLVILAALEHTRTLAPSPALVFFISITALLDLARVRTLYLMGEAFPAVTLSVGLALRLLLLVLESRSKKNDLAALPAETSPEKLAGPISRTMFHWVNPLLILGFKGSLKEKRLGPIDPKFDAEYLTNRFAPVPQHVKKGLPKGGLSTLALACIGMDLLCPIIPRLFVSFFTFMQPFLPDCMLSWLARDDRGASNQGYGLIAATFFVYFGIAASYSWYWHQVNRSVTMIRGGLVVVLFDKLLLLAENPSVESRAMTLMFSDTQRVMTAMNYFHELWAGVFDAAIATWLLYRKTGAASFAMLAVTIMSSIACASLSNKLSGMQQQWLAAVKQRLGPTKRMLSSLKAVKMLSVSDRISSTITALRYAELAAAWPFRRLRIVTTAISYSTITLSPPLVFGVCIALATNDDGLDVSKLFTSLSLINLLATPVMHLCQAIPVLGAAHGCMARIQDFLELEEQSERRITVVPSRRPETEDGNILSLRNVSLGWLAGKPILHNISLDVKRGSRVAILGRIGSGKSLLLKGLLSEVEEISGDVAVDEAASFAYCSQTPWLENTSAEENWTGRSAARNPASLGKMIQDYALKDIQELQDYKTGTIGSQGVKLSGGQRHRLASPLYALARALSLDRDTVILDDVFSALDRRTKLHVAKSLLRRPREGEAPNTVIFSTHDEQIANMADEVYEIDQSGTLTRRAKMDCPPDASPAGSVSSMEVKEEVSTAEQSQTCSPSSMLPPAAQPTVKDMDVYKTYLRSMGLGSAVAFLLLGGAFAVAFKFPDVWIQWWSNDTSSGVGRHSTGYWIGLYAGLQCIPLVLLGLWLWHVFCNIVPAVGISIHTNLLTTVMDVPFGYISNVDSGSIMNRFNQDLMFIDSLLPFDLFNTVAELYIAVIQIVFVAVASAQALAAVPAIAAVLYAIQNFYLRTSKQLRILELEAKAVLHSLVSEVTAGAGPSTIRTHGWQGHLRARFMESLDVSQEPIYLLFCVQRWLQLVLNLVVMGLVVLVAGVAVVLRAKVNPGAVGVAFLNATTLGETLTQLVMSYTSLETSLGAIARTTMYQLPSATQDEESWSLRGITVEIPAGQKVSICGRTGSGKSTSILALLRMVDIPTGVAYLGGRDHSRLPLAELRRGYFVVAQDLPEEWTTLRDQIDPNRQFTDEQIHQVVAECGLQEIIEASGGLGASATHVQLSNGEPQFLSLARVILHGCSREGGILLLDEATSSLDEDTQRRMEALIESRFQDKTIISVCHRLSWALKSDRIIVLEKGEVIHDGRPADIVQESALFAGMSLPDSEQ